MTTRLTASKITPVRTVLLKKQGYRCPMCGGSMRATSKKSPVLDHDHQTGFIRDVLCRNCNGIEGKVFNLARRAKDKRTEVGWLKALIEYHERHAAPQHGGLIHPLHKTEDEKRLARNAKARKKRAAAKAAANK